MKPSRKNPGSGADAPGPARPRGLRRPAETAAYAAASSALAAAAALSLEAAGPVAAAAVAWVALGYGMSCLGYAGGGPDVLGKRPDGSVSPPAAAALFAAQMLWRGAVILLRRGSALRPVRVGEGVWISSRPFAFNLPELAELGIAGVVDLTSEFPSALRGSGIPALHLPVLDRTAPDPGQIAEAVDLIAGHAAQGREVLVHCAFGKGRSATVVAAWLLARGAAATPDAALHALRAAGAPPVLSPEQRTALAAFAEGPPPRRAGA